MSLNALFRNCKNSPNEYHDGSFSHNPNYITEKLLCNRMRTILRIKVVLAITGIVLFIPTIIAGILIVKHLMT